MLEGSFAFFSIIYTRTIGADNISFAVYKDTTVCIGSSVRHDSPCVTAVIRNVNAVLCSLICPSTRPINSLAVSKLLIIRCGVERNLLIRITEARGSMGGRSERSRLPSQTCVLCYIENVELVLSRICSKTNDPIGVLGVSLESCSTRCLKSYCAGFPVFTAVGGSVDVSNVGSEEHQLTCGVRLYIINVVYSLASFSTRKSLVKLFLCYHRNSDPTVCIMIQSVQSVVSFAFTACLRSRFSFTAFGYAFGYAFAFIAVVRLCLTFRFGFST